MIETDMISYLEADTTLDTLLGSAAGNSKIYPELPKKEPVAPYVIFNWSVGDVSDELINEDRIQVTITGSSKANAVSIRDRLIVLLDKQDGIQDTTFTSTDYWIYWCKLTGGDSLYNSERGLFYIVLFFTVRYKKKT